MDNIGAPIVANTTMRKCTLACKAGVLRIDGFRKVNS